jgi:hypothetical protein
MGEYLAQGRTTRYLSAMDPPKAMPTEQGVTWPKFLTCTLHMATGERVQTLPGNLKDLRGPVGDCRNLPLARRWG